MTMFKTDYNKTFKYIKRNLEDITAFANDLLKSKDFLGALDDFGCEDDYMDFDYWNCYKNKVDINICGTEDGEGLVCNAYPVVHGVPNYDGEYEVLITLKEGAY